MEIQLNAKLSMRSNSLSLSPFFFMTTIWRKMVADFFVIIVRNRLQMSILIRDMWKVKFVSEALNADVNFIVNGVRVNASSSSSSSCFTALFTMVPVIATGLEHELIICEREENVDEDVDVDVDEIKDEHEHYANKLIGIHVKIVAKICRVDMH